MKIMRRLAIALLAFCLALAIAAGGLLWRLSSGPLSLAWLQPVLDDMVQRNSPFAITFDAPSLVWEPEENLLVLQVHDFEAHAENGQLVARAPLLRGTVALAPLLKRQIDLVHARIELPKIGLTRGKDGRLALRFDGQLAEVPLGETTGDGGGIGALLGDAPGSGDPRLASLQGVEISAPLLEYDDAGAEAKATATDALFSLERRDTGWAASLTAQVGNGRITGSGQSAATPPLQDVTIELEDIQPSQLVALAPNLPLAGMALPLSGTIRFTIDPTTAQPGGATLDLTAEAGEIGIASLGLAPIVIKQASLKAQVERGMQAAEISQLQLVSDGFALSGSGKLGYANGQPTADVAVTADDLDVPEILRIWPTQVVPDARKWVVDNVPAGKIGGAKLRMAQRGPQPGQQDLAGSLTFSGLEVRYLGTLPSVGGLGGTATLAGDSLAIQTSGGRTGEVDLGPAQITLSNLLGAGITQLKAQLGLSSTLPAAMRLLDAKPIELGRQTGLTPDRTSGRQTTTATVQLPLIDPLPDNRIVYRINSRLTNVEAREVTPGYSAAADSLVVTAAPSGVTAKGDARVNGVPLAVDFFQTDKPAADGVRRRVAATGRLDRPAVERLRFTWPEMIGGTVGVNARLVERHSPMRTIDVDLDLGAASANIPELRLTKQSGQPGTASMMLTQPDATSLSIDQARLTIPGWTAQGTGAVRLDPLRPQRISLTRLDSPLGDLSLGLFQQGGVWRGNIDIGSFDARPLMEASPAQGSAGGAGAGSAALPDFSVTLAARRLQLGETPLGLVLGSVAYQAGRWQSASLTGDIQGSKVTLDLTPAGNLSALHVTGTDAGWIIRSISSSDAGVRGGSFHLTANLDQAASSLSGTGELKIRNFTMWGAPTIARIVSLASFTGLGHALSGQGVPVSRLIVPFRLRNDVLTLEVARLVASDIGARADGTIDLCRQADRPQRHGSTRLHDQPLPRPHPDHRLIDVRQPLRRLPGGNLPDGGALAQPSISVNPLSALVPGFIRDLFGGFDTDPNSAAE